MVPNPKDQGHIAVLRLICAASSRGYRVLRPEGDNDSFDLVLLTEKNRFLRVQIKSTKTSSRKGHSFAIKRGGKRNIVAYTPEEVDFVACYAFDDESWYFVPIDELGRRKHIRTGEGTYWQKFHNNWEVLQ